MRDSSAGRAFALKQLRDVLLVIAGSAFCASAQTNFSQEEFTRRLVAAAIERTHHSVRYVSDYVCLSYPGGDVPADTGVCTDEIIRIYRVVGIDLQKEVHEDMVHNFDLYPHKWQRHPNTNIDHRRVPNLMVFFARKGSLLPITRSSQGHLPGDIVAWDLGGGITHIGLVVERRGRDGTYMVVHNIGRGPQMEDVLFDWRIIGHYRLRRTSRVSAKWEGLVALPGIEPGFED
jgi:uncharacterized protein YijF (DUF1287 family)